MVSAAKINFLRNEPINLLVFNNHFSRELQFQGLPL